MSNQLYTGHNRREMKELQGLRKASGLLYLIGAKVRLLAVRIAVIRVVRSGPGQRTLLFLPEITDGNIPGNLQRIVGRTDRSKLWLT